MTIQQHVDLEASQPGRDPAKWRPTKRVEARELRIAPHVQTAPPERPQEAACDEAEPEMELPEDSLDSLVIQGLVKAKANKAPPHRHEVVARASRNLSVLWESSATDWHGRLDSPRFAASAFIRKISSNSEDSRSARSAMDSRSVIDSKELWELASELKLSSELEATMLLSHSEGLADDQFQSQFLEAEEEEEQEQPMDEPGTWHGLAASVQRDYRFQGFMAILILANSIVLWLETDMSHLFCWDLVEDIFLLIFVAEMLLKMWTFGLAKFFDIDSHDFSWNLLDFVIVVLGSLDFLWSLYGKSAGGFATVFRIIRIFRILRVFRIVKYLRQLYMVAVGFAVACIAVFWVICLMAFMMYVCAIPLVRFFGHVPDSDPHAAILQKQFGSIGKTMFTLFELIATRNVTAYHAVMADRPALSCFLIGWIMFSSLGLVGLMTGVITESFFHKNAVRKEQEAETREAMRKRLVKLMGILFDQFCQSKAAEIGEEDAVDRAVLRSMIPELNRILQIVDIHCYTGDLDLMVDCLASDENDKVSRSEFRRCILQLGEVIEPLRILELRIRVFAVSMKSQRCHKILAKIEEQHQVLAERRRQRPKAVALLQLATRLTAVGRAMEELSQRVLSMEGQVRELIQGVAWRLELDELVRKAEVRRTLSQLQAEESDRHGFLGLSAFLRQDSNESVE